MDRIKKSVIRDVVRKFYDDIAESEEQDCGCGPTGCCGNNEVETADKSAAIGYSPEEVDLSPEGSNVGIGCSNPQAIASLKPGETVLDLGT